MKRNAVDSPRGPDYAGKFSRKTRARETKREREEERREKSSRPGKKIKIVVTCIKSQRNIRYIIRRQ